MKERQNNLLKAIHEIQNEASVLDEDAWLSDVVRAFHRELYDKAAGEVWGRCPECDELVVVEKNGDMTAASGCNYGPSICRVCGGAPCDQSC